MENKEMENMESNFSKVIILLMKASWEHSAHNALVGKYKTFEEWFEENCNNFDFESLKRQ